MESFFLDESRRLRTVWRLGLFWFGFLTVQGIVGIAAFAGLMAYLKYQGTDLGVFFRDPHFLEAWQVQLQIAAAVPMTAADFGLVYVFRRYFDQRSMSSVGLIRP